jgi:hypothetical protein
MLRAAFVEKSAGYRLESLGCNVEPGQIMRFALHRYALFYNGISGSVSAILVGPLLLCQPIGTRLIHGHSAKTVTQLASNSRPPSKFVINQQKDCVAKLVYAYF